MAEPSASQTSENVRSFGCSPNNRQAIVFLHGFSDSHGGAWRRFPDLVSDKLADWNVYSISYATSFRPDILGIWEADPQLPDVSNQFRTQLSCEPFVGYERLVILAHSMGGLVAQRALLDDPVLRAKVVHLFLFGTPSAGLIKAALVKWWNRQLANMAYGGGYIQKLRQDWETRLQGAPPFCFHVVAGSKDQFVPPYSSLEPFPERFHRFIPGNHLEMVRAMTADHAAVSLVTTSLKRDCLHQRLDGEPLPADLHTFGSAALRDRLAALPPSPEPRDVSKLAIDLDGAGMRDDAISLLTRFVDLHPDVRGTLAGRYKRMWLEGRGREWGEKASQLYEEAYKRVCAATKVDFKTAFYLAINLAFLVLCFWKDNEVAKQWAEWTLQWCDRVPFEERDYWWVATVAEANLYLGDYDQALQRYAEALGMVAEEDRWQCESTGYQAACIVSYLGDQVLTHELERCFAEPA
jgi:pimeloyl-ACP methyl ester carboxylesterase